jgi:hypothetical protein
MLASMATLNAASPACISGVVVTGSLHSSAALLRLIVEQQVNLAKRIQRLAS